MSDYENGNGRNGYSGGGRRGYGLDDESENRHMASDETTLSLLQEQKKINAELMDDMKQMQQQIRMMASTMMNMNGGCMGQNNMSSMGFGNMMGGMGMMSNNGNSVMKNPMMGGNMMAAGNGAMGSNMAGMPLGGITSNMGQGYRDDSGGGKMGGSYTAPGGGFAGSRNQPYNMRVPKQPGDWDCPLCGNMNFSRRNTCNGKAGSGTCGEEKKPEYVRVGVPKDQNNEKKDWDCNKCGNNNYSYRDRCNKCGVDRMESMMFGPPQKKQSTDWHCPRCRNMNYHYRTVCNRQNCDFEKKDLPNQGNPGMSPSSSSLTNMEAMAAMMNSMQSMSNSMGIPPPMGGMGLGMPLHSAGGNMNPGNRGGGGGGGKVTLRRHTGPEPREGDWECPRCYNLNFGSRDMCNGTKNGTDCRLKKPEFVKFGVKAWKNASTIKDTDWDCWRCGNVNFQNRDTCNRCKLSRADAQSDDLRILTV